MSHVFISYSHKDTPVMQRLRQDLLAANLSVWTDESLIPGTDAWETEVEHAIETAGCIVAILSPDAKESRWVRREISYAENHRIRVFAVLARGDVNDAIPLSLSQAQRVDVRYNYAPEMRKLLDALLHHLDIRRPAQQAEEAAEQRMEAIMRSKLGTSPLRPSAKPAEPAPKRESLRKAAPTAAAPRTQQPIGTVLEYYQRIGVAGIELTDTLRFGDVIRCHGARSDFVQRAESIEIDRQRVNVAHAGDQIGLRVAEPVRIGETVYRVGQELIGTVMQYFSNLKVAGIELTGALHVGDIVHIHDQASGFLHRAESIELNRKRVNTAPAGSQIGLLVNQPTSVGAHVHRIVMA